MLFAYVIVLFAVSLFKPAEIYTTRAERSLNR